MKRLRFSELLLLSEKEKAAKAVAFGRRMTVIRAPNDFGKSCLIKSLYMALGATPSKVSQTWSKVDATLLLHFQLDETDYSILKTSKKYTLFNSDGEFLSQHQNITRQLGPALASLFDFHLQLTDKNTKKPEQATPALLFMPFYFDQDRSWVESWASFEAFGQYARPKEAVAEFHTGQRPNEYYLAKSRKIEATERQEVIRKERNVVKRVLEKIEYLMKESQFDMDVVNYENEVQLLLARCNELKQEEQRVRDQMVQTDNRRVAVEKQIQITESAADELELDLIFAEEQLEEIECPVCGQEYHNSFAERFGLADDEDQMRSLLTELQKEREECIQQVQKDRSEVGQLTGRISEINELLEVRQGEIKLRDVLRSEGKKEVRTVLREELDELNRTIGSIDNEIEDSNKEMRKCTQKKRITEIKEFYRTRMKFHLQLLGVANDEAYSEVCCVIKETGSDGPRALLAYYFAILKTIEEYSSTTRCPIVVDAAKQQEQDDTNWKNMLHFIKEHAPPESQVIVGLVDDLGIDMGGDVVLPKEKYHLLQKSDYAEVRKRMAPYLEIASRGF